MTYPNGTDERRPVDEATFEAMADRRVQRALAGDPRYRHAENAEEQKQAEETIEREVLAELDRLYRVTP